ENSANRQHEPGECERQQYRQKYVVRMFRGDAHETDDYREYDPSREVVEYRRAYDYHPEVGPVEVEVHKRLRYHGEGGYRERGRKEKGENERARPFVAAEHLRCYPGSDKAYYKREHDSGYADPRGYLPLSSDDRQVNLETGHQKEQDDGE